LFSSASQIGYSCLKPGSVKHNPTYLRRNTCYSFPPHNYDFLLLSIQGRVAKQLWESNQLWPTKPERMEIVQIISPKDNEDRKLHPMETEKMQDAASRTNAISDRKSTLLLSRPRRSIQSKDANNIIQSASVMLQHDSPKNATDQKSIDEESMDTAENVLFHPLFVHRLKKADRNRRRQSQMRPQNRPQKPPKQGRPQQRPTQGRPQQRPQPIRRRPQRPATSTPQKKPQSTRRGQFFYVAAAGPLGQWVYYPYYYL